MRDSQSQVGVRDKSDSSIARPQDEMKIVDDLAVYFRTYARERPQTVALVCLGVGFVLGWKLKPW